MSDIRYAVSPTREIMGLPQPVVAAPEDAECPDCGGDPETCKCGPYRGLSREDIASIKGDERFHLLRDEGKI